MRRSAARPRGFETDAALDQAVEVFWRRRYAGAGLAELTAAMGISPPSLYAAFGDKRGLFLAALDRYAATFGAQLLDALRAAEDSVKLKAFLAAAVDLAFDGERGRGCLAACGRSTLRAMMKQSRTGSMPCFVATRRCSRVQEGITRRAVACCSASYKRSACGRVLELNALRSQRWLRTWRRSYIDRLRQRSLAPCMTYAFW
jgi:AcrR family transcriptional regulator